MHPHAKALIIDPGGGIPRRFRVAADAAPYYRRVHIEKGEHFSFEAVEGDGSVHVVPLHEVREV